MGLSRRHFLRNAGAIALGFTGLQACVGSRTGSSPQFSSRVAGYGPLIPDPQGIVDLPQGFSYQIISTSGDLMDDGFIVPADPDGMATFPGPDGLTIIVRNHEVNPGAGADEGPFGADNGLLSKLPADALYDAGHEGRPALGGTTTLVYDTRSKRLVRQYLSLAGTLRNCAGGPTPWNSWITCEEIVVSAGGDLMKDHGYAFEVPASATPRLAKPEPLLGLGRFNHEAVAVDPQSGIVYQTEDQGDGLIYRFIPNNPGQLAEGGRLQALAFRDEKSMDTRNWERTRISPGDSMRVKWIDLEDIQSPEDNLRHQGFDKGAARFARGEGMWYGNGKIYFACTNGGSARKGQIWAYTPEEPFEGRYPARLSLFIEPNDGTLIDNADNLTVAPWGDLFVCEDGSGDQFIVGVTPEGGLYQFAHNAGNFSEWAGATFSPDGTTLFVNIQGSGQTFAITGPW